MQQSLIFLAYLSDLSKSPTLRLAIIVLDTKNAYIPSGTDNKTIKKENTVHFGDSSPPIRKAQFTTTIQIIITKTAEFAQYFKHFSFITISSFTNIVYFLIISNPSFFTSFSVCIAISLS